MGTYGRPRRMVRTFRAPAAIPRQIALILDAQYQKANKPVRPMRRTMTVAPEAYTHRTTTPIAAGNAAGTVPVSGIISLTVGPSGLGTVWYPQSAACATSTGAADTSTCAFYVGPLGLQTLIGGQSYAGGGDSVGLAVPPLFPGYFITATWTGAKSGDLATLTIYGQQEALTP